VLNVKLFKTNRGEADIEATVIKPERMWSQNNQDSAHL